MLHNPKRPNIDILTITIRRFMTSKDHKTTSPEIFSKVVFPRLVCKENQNRQPHHHYVMIHSPGRPQKQNSMRIFCTTNPQHYETPTSGFLSQIRRSACRTQLRPKSFKLKRLETHLKRKTRRHKTVLKIEHRPGEKIKPDDCCAHWRHNWPTPRPRDRWQPRTLPSCLPTWWQTPNLAWNWLKTGLEENKICKCKNKTGGNLRRAWEWPCNVKKGEVLLFRWKQNDSVAGFMVFDLALPFL